MKQNGMVVNMPDQKIFIEEVEDFLGDEHVGTSYDTPLREDAFDMADDEKIKIISRHFAEIMHTLGLDLTDDSLSGTPERVAKMFIKEIFSGLNPKINPSSPYLKISTSTIRCSWKRISRSIQTVSTILSLSLGKHILLIYPPLM